ncbi:putative RNA-directed DNA polymerase from transposon X-element [Trichonephila clavipes]|nr:putative RNA-directed DNA polymerase from transposon X-element [Trichonephila clavipes]
MIFKHIPKDLAPQLQPLGEYPNSRGALDLSTFSLGVLLSFETRLLKFLQLPSDPSLFSANSFLPFKFPFLLFTSNHSLHSLMYFVPSLHFSDKASLYVDDLQISFDGSDMRMIEWQLQTAVNNIVKWCDTNGHSISASKSCCVHFCRKRGIHPGTEIRIRDVRILVVPDVRFLGVIFDRRLTFLPHILQLRKNLPAPFVVLGDFNGHSTLCGSVKTNPSGTQIEKVLFDHCLCLLNHEEPTYVHEPTRSFHTLDLAFCSPSLLPNLNLSVEKDLYNSDHFPIIVSHDYDTSGKTFPLPYSYNCADWALFTQLGVISNAMVKTESVDTAVQKVSNVLITAADVSIPKNSSHSFQRYKP